MEKLKGQLESYKEQPFSLVLRLLMWIATFLTVGITVCIVGYILIRGIPNLSPEMFAWEYNTENVSMMPAIINTVLMVLLVLLIAVPVGIGAAIYLVEYAKRGSKLVKLVRITAETLSGIPSIVYGLFGYLLFATTFRWGYTFLGGALTLAIMILPLILRTTEEALKAKQTELTLMEKDIQIAKLTQKTEMERAEADRKFDAIMEEYLKCEPFFIEFLKLLGRRVTKRNEQGEIVETKAVYDIYLEARERRRKRMTGAAMSTRRLPDISGIVDTSDTAPGGVESGGKRPTVPACPEL